MPKYYCDYCDVFLTHDSPSVRKSHNDGWKHKAAVRAYYAQFEQDLTQSLIQQKLKEYQEGKGTLPTHFYALFVLRSSFPNQPLS
jgi:U1 small nuclear ribonucleoprotein C